MAQILIRNLDEKLVRRLKRQAKAGGRSLQSEAKSILEQAAQPEPPQLTRAELIAKLERFRKSFKGRVFSDSTQLIRQDREER
jgi:plasmid stability protein